MASQAKNNKIATIISGIFFLLISLVLFYVTFSLRSEAQGREMKISLADLYSKTPTYGDYLTIADTGAVISAATNVVDESGLPIGRAFILNGISDYVFLIGVTDEFTDTTGTVKISLQPGMLIPAPFYARINTENDGAPMGTEEFAIQNGLSTGQKYYCAQIGVTKTDTTVPFYLTLAFGIIGLVFSAASWRGLVKKNAAQK
jgi:hypothetical protein